MATTMKLIASSTVGAGGAANINFTSIPQTYTDLCLKVFGRSTSTTFGILLNFNGTTSGYTGRWIEGDGANVIGYPTSNELGGYISYSPNTANVFGMIEVYIPNYALSTNKSYVINSAQESNTTTAYSTLGAQLLSNTAAITSINMSINGSNNFAEYSSAYLYGIVKQ
jgi:hypothetical protein